MKLKYLFIPMVVTFLVFACAKIATEHFNASQSTELLAYSSYSDQEVQKVVELFFEGFHKQDSTIIKKAVHENVMLQSIGKNQLGEIELSKQDFSGFLKSICSIPETMEFEERIHSYEVKTDGKMANVWTPYSFYVDGALSHCGTNSFQLYKRNGVWKIFYIVDTRDRNGCEVKRG